MIITVAHQKGGTGKSTLSTNLCGYMKTDLLDMDKQFSSASWNARRIANGKYPGIPTITVEEQHCKVPYQTPVPLANLWKGIVRKYKGNAENHLVIDCPGFESDALCVAIWLSDYVLTPVAPSQIEVYGLEIFEQVIKKAETLGDGKRKIVSHVVINNADNRSKQRTMELRDYVNSDPHYTLCRTSITRNMAFWDAYKNGCTVPEFKSNGSAMEVKLLAQEIMDTLGI